jgi:phosphoribosylanthranilate isomerase
MSKIKICGLSRQPDIDAVNQVLPDYIGFVFVKSRRQVNADTARELKHRLSPSIKAVGVFVNEDIHPIVSLCNSHIIDIIQLHGDENEAYIKELRNHVSNPVIKAIRVKDSDDIKKAGEISCDYLLFDTYQDNQYGGSGKVFNWSVLTEITKPFFLAGGIDSGNILMANNLCNPYCIDVSSGVETGGVKDAAKIKEIVELIRMYPQK